MRALEPIAVTGWSDDRGVDCELDLWLGGAASGYCNISEPVVLITVGERDRGPRGLELRLPESEAVRLARRILAQVGAE